MTWERLTETSVIDGKIKLNQRRGGEAAAYRALTGLIAISVAKLKKHKYPLTSTTYIVGDRSEVRGQTKPRELICEE